MARIDVTIKGHVWSDLALSTLNEALKKIIGSYLKDLEEVEIELEYNRESQTFYTGSSKPENLKPTLESHWINL